MWLRNGGILICSLLVASIAAHSEPRTQSPSVVGLDEEALRSLDAEIAQGKLGLVDHLLVIRCGADAFERSYSQDYRRAYAAEVGKKGPLNARGTGPYNYFDPSWHPYLHGSDLHTLQSITKTITTITYGVAITRGDFKAPLDTPVLRYFSSSTVRNVDARKQRMTLRDVLTMSTGFDWNEDLPYDNPGNTAIGMEAVDDWVQYVIDRPMAHEPGKVFAYNSGAAELLAYIFKAETGQDIERYAEAHLFHPLGITRHYWKRNPMGLVDTEGGLYLTAADLAKIGLLYLQKGLWRGHVIVSSDWVAQSVQPLFDAGGGWRYGYMWWLWPHGPSGSLAFVGRGFGGQVLLVDPDSSLILVVNGWDILGNTPVMDAAVKEVLAAVRSPTCPAR